MSKTENVKFDKAVLPEWAQKQSMVVWLCSRNLEFRANVCTAVGNSASAYRQVLIKQAEKSWHQHFDS
jgi:hypothetical protein